jgi:hypothetical protein
MAEGCLAVTDEINHAHRDKIPGRENFVKVITERALAFLLAFLSPLAYLV